MDVETLNNFFEPFLTTRNMVASTVHCLPAEYGIGRNHGGKLRVRNEAGRGSRFGIYLPRFEAEDAK